MKGVEFFDGELYISYRNGTSGTYIEKWTVDGERIYKKKIDARFTSFIILDKDILIGTNSGKYTTIYNVNMNTLLISIGHSNSYCIILLF